MKWKNRVVAFYSLVVIVALLLSAFTVSPVFAKGASQAVTAPSIKVSAQEVSAPVATGQIVNIHSLATVRSATTTKSHRAMPLLVSPNLAKAKQSAAQNKLAPVGRQALSAAGSAGAKGALTGFNGMADSTTICPYFGGCQPPDMALASSPQLVLQGVNTSFALYNTHGSLVAGPVNEQVFFGIPNPGPAHCDPAGPFTSDPRAFYDPNDGYFWVALLQVENAVGIAPTCKFLSRYWIANINASTMSMCVYRFDMALGTTNVADYTQFGFSASSIAFSGNMFTQDGSAYAYAEAQFADKHAMEQCQPVTPTAFTRLNAGGVLVDTVQPVETETTPANDPGVQYLVNSFNMNGDPFGDNCFFIACQGFAVWAFDPASKKLSGTFTGTGIPNPLYIAPPNADEPGCLQCIETIDTRITGTPVYSVGGGQGLISFSLDSAVSNGGPIFPNAVPGILWGQIQVGHITGFVVANLYQSGYLFFAGDQDASFGAMMQDKSGRLFMVFDTMSANLNPGIMIVSRNKSDPLGTIGNARFIIKGPVATLDLRWGDFEAASYTGFSSNHVWVASQYSISGDWATFIARVS
jgi:hypothetical protein